MRPALKALIEVIDADPMCVSIHEDAGRIVHQNQAFVTLLSGSRHAPAIEAGTVRGAKALGLVIDAGALLDAQVHQELSAGDARYVIRALPAPLGERLVLVRVTSATFARPMRVPRGSTLTAREVDVAVRMARGETNREIAVSLAITVHTARHHAENVLKKLSLNSRAKVAARLLGAPRVA
jgi:DNA-binding NarL/FixJ family response regulator